MNYLEKAPPDECKENHPSSDHLLVWQPPCLVLLDQVDIAGGAGQITESNNGGENGLYAS